MSDRWVSFSIKATKNAGDVGDLYEASWALLAATIQKNAKHASAKEILGDYLDETLDDGKDLADAKHLEFACLSPAGACDVQAAVAEHWFTLAIALASKELGALCRENGYEMKPLRATARDLATAERKVPFIPNGNAIVAIQRKAKPLVLVDAGEELPIDEADLTPAARKLALAAAKSGRCACPFCAKIRANEAVVAKPKKEPKSTNATPRSTAPSELERFENLEKALRRPERCGWLALAKMPSGNPELSPDIGKLVSLKALSLNSQLTKLPDSIGDLRCLESLSLKDAKLTEVPPAILRLARLRQLNLGSLSRLQVPLPNLGVLAELESLDLSRLRLDGGIDEIDFSSLEKLVELDLGATKMSELPSTLRGLPALAKLSIDQAKLTHLPDTLSTLTGLTTLTAWASSFTSWPGTLNDLPRLTTIDFRQSALANIDALRSMPALRTLDLRDTPLAKSTEQIDALKRRMPHVDVIV